MKKAPKKAKAKKPVNATLTPRKTDTRSDERLPEKSRLKTGQFAPGASGNPDGRPEGSKNERTEQWEALGEAIQGKSADKFTDILHEFMGSPMPALRLKGAELFLKALEYFKPKLQRTELKAPPGSEVTYTLKFK